MKMIVYCGFHRTTEVEVEVKDLGLGAGEIDCLECGGDGDWTKYHPENIPTVCVECKGTGKILIAI